MVRRVAAVLLASALVVGGSQVAWAASASGPGDAGVPFWVDDSHLGLVSESGTAVGTYQDSATLFRGGTRVALGHFTSVQVNDINATGTSAGRLDHRAATWSPTGTATVIPDPPGRTSNDTADINDAGDVLVRTFGGGPFTNGAAVWRGGALTALHHNGSPLWAVAMNNTGTVIANTDGDPQTERLLLRCTLAGACTVLPLPVGSTLPMVQALNDAGTIVGTVELGGVRRVVVWDAAGGPTLLPALAGGTTTTLANTRHAINAAGDIVGYSGTTAVVWRSGLPTALPGGRQLTITDQNNRGDIVGSAPNALGNPRPFVLLRGTSFTEVGTLFLLPRGEIRAISDKGLAVGASWFSVSAYPGAGISNLRATTWQVS